MVLESLLRVGATKMSKKYMEWMDILLWKLGRGWMTLA
jgi:hypothetical protein